MMGTNKGRYDYCVSCKTTRSLLEYMGMSPIMLLQVPQKQFGLCTSDLTAELYTHADH